MPDRGQQDAPDLPGQPAVQTIALYGGAVIYLIGRFLFLRLTVRPISPAQLVAIAAILVLLPAGRYLPVPLAFGLLTALLTALVCYERLGARPDPTRQRPRDSAARVRR